MCDHDFALNGNSATAHVGMCVISLERRCANSVNSGSWPKSITCSSLSPNPLQIIWLTADGDHGHRGVRSHDAFNLGWKDLEAAAVDHVLAAIDDEYRAILIHAGEVAGVQPAVRLDSLARCRFISVITLHDDGAAYHQFADLSVWHRLAGVANVGDASIDVGERNADGAKLVRAVRRKRRTEARQLRHAPQFDEGTAETLLDLIHLCDRHGLAANRAA